MSLSKFQVKNTGTVFFHNNQSNVLLDKDMQPLFRAFDKHDEIADLLDRFGTDRKVKNPETIKITLGHGCNYSCGYCMQKDIGNPDERPANGLTSLLIQNIKRHLDLSDIQRIELWGGETLLYWKDMVQIMEALDREGLTWYVPTNGTPLMHKHVDFWMQLKGNVAMGISHDGPAHEQLRGKEFLHKKVDVFKRIQQECFPKIQFSFNPVISSTNYDLFEIDAFFSSYFAENDLHPTTLSYELGRVYDENMAENSTHHVIKGGELKKYQTILRKYLDAHIVQFKEHGYAKTGKLLANSLFHTGMGVIPYAKTLREEAVPLLKSNCGVDDSRLISMDMLGNVRTCQNTDERYIGGNLIDVRGIRMQKIDINRDDFCGTCPVYRLCKSSCPLDLGSAVFHTNHNIERIHYGEIQLAAFRLLFGGDVELLETNITT